MESWGFVPRLASKSSNIQKSIETHKPHIIISESHFSGLDSSAILKTVTVSFEIPVIFIEKGDSIDGAVRALKSGAYDYFSEPVDIVRLKKVMENISANIEILDQSQKLKEQLDTYRHLNGRLIGNSPKMKEIFEQIEICAPSEAPVFIIGASGTGKELVASAIHDLSPRKNGPFIAINCSAIPDTLLESEIFGHEKGAFTGAIKRKEGCFEIADGGTFFLDEIVEMAPDLQTKLLRVLESGTFRRVGGNEELKADVRVVSASNRNINDAIRDGIFREDLFYRLNVFLLNLAPLKDRPGDIPILAQHFIEEFNIKSGKNIQAAEPQFLEVLKNHDWPGNVRELRNVIERSVIVAKSNILAAQDLPSYLMKREPFKGPTISFEIGATDMDGIEARVILSTLEHLKGKKSEAAKVLGLSLKTLYNKLNIINKG